MEEEERIKLEVNGDIYLIGTQGFPVSKKEESDSKILEVSQEKYEKIKKELIKEVLYKNTPT